jgi:Rrf2 family protein
MNLGFTRRTDLALSALRALAEANERMTRSGLAGQIGTTPSFLPQVLSPLIDSGWVTSERGPGGGYQLTDAAFDARLLQVIEATGGPATTGRCVLRDGPCPGPEACQLHDVWTEAQRVLVEGFDGKRVLQNRERGEPRI